MKAHWSKRLREALDAKGWSHSDLSTRSGVGIENIKKYAQGQVDHPRGDAPMKMATALGVTTEWLMFGTGASPKTTKNENNESAGLSGKRIVSEINVRGGLGAGGESILENFTLSNGHTISADSVRGEWLFPDDYLAEIRVRSRNVRIIEVFGDSMEKDDGGGILSGDRVMIDISDRNPTPPGIFAVWDGFGIVVKRIERVPQSDPPAIKLISDNPSHEPYILTADEAGIIGRLIWFARRL